AAEAELEAMRQVLQKAKFAWIPIVRTSVALAPGVNIECDDVNLTTTEGNAQSFQYCRPPGGGSIYNIRDYLSQIGGVLVRFNFDLVIPLYTFGKFKNVKKMAASGVALRKLERERYRQETVLRVYQAFATLQLARESIEVLDEAWKMLGSARNIIQKDLGDEDSEPEDINEERDPADLTRLELVELEIEERMYQARSIEAQALASLRALAGRAAPQNFDIVDTPLTPDEISGGMQPVAHYRKISATTRPEAKQAGEFVELRKAAEKLARSNFLPDIGIILSGKFQYVSSADTPSELYYSPYYNYNLLFAALGVQWNLNFHNYTWDLRKARAERIAAEHRNDAAKILLGLEVDRAYQNVRQSAH
ncbi:MAG: TolC family protein, partial [Nannocystaceae bacterium]